MIAALLELNHCRAAVALLPPLLPGSVDELFGRWILRTVTRRVSFVVADSTHLGAAPLAFADLPAAFSRDMTRLDPFATILPYAINPVLGFVFLELAIPRLLELLVEELVHMFQVDVIVCATARRHMRWIGDGHFEYSLKTRMTHAVFAR